MTVPEKQSKSPVHWPYLQVEILTIFPEYLAPLHLSLFGKAIAEGRIVVNTHDLRDWATDVHHSVDDSPYGGGPGMVMRPTVWGPALDDVYNATVQRDPILIVPSPAGILFTQSLAEQLAEAQGLIFACGRYEGIDQRVIDDAEKKMKVLEVSIGDFVLFGGEVAALAMLESIGRLIPGVLGNDQSVLQDSHAGDGLLEGSHYTRPAVWRGLEVPRVLLSGNHQSIAQWRYQQSLERTRSRRPDLLPQQER